MPPRGDSLAFAFSPVVARLTHGFLPMDWGIFPLSYLFSVRSATSSALQQMGLWLWRFVRVLLDLRHPEVPTVCTAVYYALLLLIGQVGKLFIVSTIRS